MIGQTIGHYRILEKIGEGGMGVVYKAEDTFLERNVALKFMRKELSFDEDSKKRFIHEAKASSTLDHPNICTIHEINETSDGQMYICMSYCEGESLKKMSAQKLLPIEHVVDIGSQLMWGLAEAHGRGIVHRDIKPANLILSKEGVLKIVDFGLAKLTGKSLITRPDSTVGTIAYMSPEQVRGEEVDERSDIFSVGAVLYELVTGQRPFKGDHDAAVLYQIVNHEPTPISQYRDDIPESLVLIIWKALEKEPEKRFQTSEEMKDELNKLKDRLISGTTYNNSHKSGRLGTFGRIAVAVAAVAVIAWVVLTTVFRDWVDSPLKDLAVAVVDFRDIDNPDDYTTSAGITSLIQVGLVESSPCRIVSLEYLHDLRRRLFGAARGAIERDQALEVARESGASLLLTGQMTSLDEIRYLTLTLVDTKTGRSVHAHKVQGVNLAMLADTVIANVLPILAKYSGTEPSDKPPSVINLTTNSPEAYSYYVEGILAAEEAKVQEAVTKLQEAVRIDSSFALAFYELGRVHQHLLGDRDRAQQYAELAWGQRTRLGMKNRMRLEAWRNQTDGDIEDALTLYREIRTRWPDDREVIGDLARVLLFWWYCNEGVDVLSHGHTLYPDDYNLVLWYKNMLLAAGQPDEALMVVRKHLKNDEENPSLWDDLGWAFGDMGLPDSAEVAFRRALSIDPDYLWSQLGMARCKYQRGDVDGAISNYEQILGQNELAPGQRVWLLSYVRSGPHGLPFFYSEIGQFGKALEKLNEARRFVTGPRNEVRLEFQRAALLMRMGRAQEVLDWGRDLIQCDETPTARFEARSYMARAWIALDSLQMARNAVPTILAMEKQLGGRARFEASMLSALIALADDSVSVAFDYISDSGKYLVHSPGLRVIEYFETLAYAYWKSVQLEKAGEVYSKLLQSYGGHALARYELGRIWEAMGRIEKAKQEYNTFLEMWSGADKGIPQVENARARLAVITSLEKH